MFKISLMLLALSTASLCLPSANTDIEKRFSWPWVSSFDLDDTTCQHGRLSGLFSRVKMEDGCSYPYTPTSARIGGSWGAGLWSTNSFTAWSSVTCLGHALYTYNRTGQEHGFCFVLPDSVNASEWRAFTPGG